MTNVDKYFCPKCRRFTFIAKQDSPRSPEYSPAYVEDLGCDGRSMDGKHGYMAFNHQGKADRFIHALNGGRYILLDCHRRYKGVKFVLTDTDIMGRRFKLEHMRKSGVKRFFVYPHAARPDIVNDIYKEWAFTTAHFVSAQGHVDVMRAFGYSRPLEVVGWSLCPIREFMPRVEPREVLFAPIHPRCSKVDQDVNKGTFERLAALAYSGDIHLTVRFVRSLPDSGLERVEHPNIEWTAGAMNQMYDQIDHADVVVGHQTFLYLAVARGVPAVAMATDMPTHVQHRNKPVLWARNWKKYEHLLAYPYDIMDCKNKEQTLSLLRRAVGCDEEISDWRKRMLGSPFRKDRFLAKVERYL